MSDWKSDVPLPADPLEVEPNQHPANVPLRVSHLAVKLSSSRNSMTLAFRGPRKVDVRTREEIHLTHLLFLSRGGAETLVQQLQRALAQK